MHERLIDRQEFRFVVEQMGNFAAEFGSHTRPAQRARAITGSVCSDACLAFIRGDMCPVGHIGGCGSIVTVVPGHYKVRLCMGRDEVRVTDAKAPLRMDRNVMRCAIRGACCGGCCCIVRVHRAGARPDTGAGTARGTRAGAAATAAEEVDMRIGSMRCSNKATTR